MTRLGDALKLRLVNAFIRSEQRPDRLGRVRAGILTSLRQVLPDDVTLTVDGRRLITDAPGHHNVGIDLLGGPLFAMNKRLGVRGVAVGMMDEAWHATCFSAAAPWPPGLSGDDEPRKRIRIKRRTLHMAYTHRGRVLLACPPVDLAALRR